MSLSKEIILFRIFEKPTDTTGLEEPVALITNFNSAVWETGYNETGSFELEINATEQGADAIEIGRFVTCSAYDGVMVIRSVSLEDDVITATGFEAIYILNERVDWLEIVAGETNAINAIVQIMGDIQGAGAEKRAFPGLREGVNVESVEGTYYSVYDRMGDTALNLIQGLCQDNDLGCTMEIASSTYNYNLRLKIYEGSGEVTFSDIMGTASNICYAEDDLDFKNVGYAVGYNTDGEISYSMRYAGDDEDGDDSDDEPTGWDRAEIITVQDRSENEAMWEEWYSGLRSVALSSLEDAEKNSSYSFEVKSDNTPELGAEATIILKEYNKTYTARVSMITRTISDGQVTAEITLGTPTLLKSY